MGEGWGGGVWRCSGVFFWPFWLKMLFWRKPALTPTKNYENKTVCVFFQGASDADAKTSRNIARKLKNNEILNFKKVRFSKIDEKWI